MVPPAASLTLWFVSVHVFFQCGNSHSSLFVFSPPPPPPLPLPGMREHPPIPVIDLADHIERLKANDGLRFSQEYEVSVPIKAASVHPYI